MYPAAVCSTPNGIPSGFLFRGMVLNGIPSSFLFREMVWNGFQGFASIFVLWNGIPSYFLFRRRVRNGIRMVCFYFCSAERNSELFYLPGKGSERNSERFLFRGTAGIPSEITICSVYSVFHGIIFLAEIRNPR